MDVYYKSSGQKICLTSGKSWRNKGQADEGYSFIDFLLFDFGLVISEYLSDNVILLSVKKTNIGETLSDGGR